MKLEVIPVLGLPEFAAADDVAEQICSHATLRDGDVVVVAQKIVSKAEGRVAPADQRAGLIAQESVDVLARRGDVVIVRTRHGFVCANAGIDNSNVEPGTITLLPLDPDGSAEQIRRGIRSRTDAVVGVVVSDTFGRPWRTGQTNVALGVAGIKPMRDHRGEKDSFGRPLEATLIALADELAGAAELVMGKSDGVPVAIIRGLEGAAGDGSVSELLRPVEEDLFPGGGVELLGRRWQEGPFEDRPVPDEVIMRAVSAASTTTVFSSGAPPWRFVWLRSSGPSETLRAPVVIEVETDAGTQSALVSAGAAIQALVSGLAVQGVAARWDPAPTPAESPGWIVLGTVSAGYRAAPPSSGEGPDPSTFLDIR